jgi:hypothetical protein
MRLIENKEYIKDDKVRNRIYWAEDNVWYSYKHIWNKQDIDTDELINSNYLMYNIYNEINR